MKRTAAILVTTIVGIATLSGCGGGGDPYCDAVDKNKNTLNTFGQKRTDAAYAKYATVFGSIGKKAPASIKKDWTTLSTVTTGIIDAQKKAGVKLEDMTDSAKVKKLYAGAAQGAQHGLQDVQRHDRSSATPWSRTSCRSATSSSSDPIAQQMR